MGWGSIGADVHHLTLCTEEKLGKSSGGEQGPARVRSCSRQISSLLTCILKTTHLTKTRGDFLCRRAAGAYTIYINIYILYAVQQDH